jgi:putative PIN family toxin of toxin-antitoxin system
VIPLVVYDTMVYFQWAALPENRQHKTIQLLYQGKVRLCISDEQIREVRDLLFRSELRSKAPSLTVGRINGVIESIIELSDFFDNVPKHFSLQNHSDDDHILNLAIEAKAHYLITWEKRLLELAKLHHKQHLAYLSLNENIKILSPAEFSSLF